jgi:hypothetical protein
VSQGIKTTSAELNLSPAVTRIQLVLFVVENLTGFRLVTSPSRRNYPPVVHCCGHSVLLNVLSVQLRLTRAFNPVDKQKPFVMQTSPLRQQWETSAVELQGLCPSARSPLGK